MREPNLTTALLNRSVAAAQKMSPRKGSPNKTQYIQSYMETNQMSFSPEVNKAIAKELYIDSTVNVVSSKDKNSVKPG